jgi:hypothetical protein
MMHSVLSLGDLQSYKRELKTPAPTPTISQKHTRHADAETKARIALHMHRKEGKNYVQLHASNTQGRTTSSKVKYERNSIGLTTTTVPQ